MNNLPIDQFFKGLFTKIGLSANEQDEILKAFAKTVTVSILGVMKDSIPKDKIRQVDQKLETSEDWIATLTEEMQKYGDRKWVQQQINERLESTFDEFINIIVKNCPEDKKEEVYQYTSDNSPSYQ